MNRPRFCPSLLLLVWFVTTSMLFCNGVALAVTIETQQIMVPAYFYHGELWSQAIAGRPATHLLIMNPNSGPGDHPNVEYVRVVQEALATGVNVAGYVHTSYSVRAAEDVRREIERYRTWYGIRDIFLDEASADSAMLSYYQSLANVIRENGGKIILNPGTAPDEQYMNVADVIVTFEGTFSSYTSASFPNWMQRYPANRFSHLVYQTSDGDMPSALRLARERNAGYVYVTDDGYPNPWDTLPSYWSTELALLAGTKPEATSATDVLITRHMSHPQKTKRISNFCTRSLKKRLHGWIAR